MLTPASPPDQLERVDHHRKPGVMRIGSPPARAKIARSLPEDSTFPEHTRVRSREGWPPTTIATSLPPAPGLMRCCLSWARVDGVDSHPHDIAGAPRIRDHHVQGRSSQEIRRCPAPFLQREKTSPPPCAARSGCRGRASRQRSGRLRRRMSGVLNETSNPGHLFSLRGFSRLLLE